jgi:hypothetical protein
MLGRILLTVVLATALAAAADEPMPGGAGFAGFRALVIAPAEVWQEWDSAVFGALEERGFEVDYARDPGPAEDLAKYDLVALNAERRLTAEQQDGLAAYVRDGGALYVGWDQPYAWGRGAGPGAPDLLRQACAVAGAQSCAVREAVLPDSPISAGLAERRIPLRKYVGCFQSGADGWNAVSVQPLPGAVQVLADEDGNCLGVLNRFGAGRAAAFGLVPEQEQYLQSEEAGPAMLDNALAWLLEDRLSAPRTGSGVAVISLPAAARVTGVRVDGRAITIARTKRVGSLRRVEVPLTGLAAGAQATVEVDYEPLAPARADHAASAVGHAERGGRLAGGHG